MKKPFVVLATTVIAASALAAAPAAVAYNKDAYAYASSRMVEAKDIPKALGTYRTGIDFYAGADSPEIFLCSLEKGSARVMGARYSFGANYRNANKKSPRSVGTSVYQFPSSKAAISGFRAVEREAKRCTGTQSDSSTGDDGVTYSWTSNLQNGKVKGVKVAGVESVFINSDYESGSSDQDREYLADTYAIYTLVNDVIIVTTFTNTNESSLKPAETKGAHQLAFNAVTAWVE
jgi:hypothetical protein